MANITLVRHLPPHLHETMINFRSRHTATKQVFITNRMYTQKIKSELPDFQCLVTIHMPSLFDRERRDPKGRSVLRSKSNYKGEIKTTLDPMLIDIFVDETYIEKFGDLI